MNLLKFMNPGICFGGGGGGGGGGGRDDRKPRQTPGKPGHNNSGTWGGGPKTPSSEPRPPVSNTGTDPNKTATGPSPAKGPVSAPSRPPAAPSTIGGDGSSSPVTAPTAADPVGGADGSREGPGSDRLKASDVKEENERDRTQRVGTEKYRRGGVARPQRNVPRQNRAARGNPFSMNKER